MGVDSRAPFIISDSTADSPTDSTADSPTDSTPDSAADATATSDPTFATFDTGRRIAYTEYGDPAGDPVVFLHGTPGSRLLASAFDSAAATAGVRLLAFDRPGFGGSDPWPARSISDAGRVVTAVLDDAALDTAALVAFSGGSQPAVATAATHGDRVSAVDIVSGATPPSVSEATPTLQRVLGTLATRAAPLLRGLFRGQAWLAARRDPSLVVSQYRADDPDTPLDDEMAAVVKADFVEAFANSRLGVVTEFRNGATDWNIDFSTVEEPITLWHGDKDTNVPLSDARRFVSVLPTATLTVNTAADHLGTLVESVPNILERVGE